MSLCVQSTPSAWNLVNARVIVKVLLITESFLPVELMAVPGHPPELQKKRSKLREVDYLAQGHTTRT